MNRRSFLGLLGVSAAALALRPKFSLLSAPSALVLEEPPEPITYPVLIGSFFDFNTMSMLKELYSDDVIYVEHVNRASKTIHVITEKPKWFTA